MAVAALVLLKLEPGKARRAIDKVTKLAGVREAHVVTGPYDGFCLAEARDVRALGDLIISKIQQVDGVEDTLTCLVV